MMFLKIKKYCLAEAKQYELLGEIIFLKILCPYHSLKYGAPVFQFFRILCGLKMDSHLFLLMNL
jgi:hypothetical protein